MDRKSGKAEEGGVSKVVVNNCQVTPPVSVVCCVYLTGQHFLVYFYFGVLLRKHKGASEMSDCISELL